MKIIIVGGVAGGGSAATRLRRLDEKAEIIMFERGEYISFANCGLPYHIGETIKERDKLLLQTPKSMKDRFNIDVRVKSEVVGVNTKSKTVKVISKEKGEYEESYDYLIVSPGAKPIKPSIKGIDSSKIYTLRNIPDMDQIKDRIDSGEVKKAVVIGGGFIGIEVAENIASRGIQVDLVEAAKQIIAPVDKEMANIATKELIDHDINVILNNGVKEFEENNEGIVVKLTDTTIIQADLVVMAIGVTPDTDFIKESGITLSDRGHILVDEHMKTSDEAIYAVGDAILVKDYISEENIFVPLAGPANRQGRIAADHLILKKSNYKGTMGTSILKVFDLIVASVGNNAKTLNRLGVSYRELYLHPMSHASYYPGSSQLTIKMLYNDTGKILGAQAVGYEGVDKFIDVIATSIKLGATVEDLTELELAYAPPFLSAKSPANMAGFIAQNDLNGLTKLITPKELEKFNSDTQVLLDIRDEMEVENGFIKESIHIPLNELRDRIDELEKHKGKEIIIYCAVGQRGHTAARLLEQFGFRVRNLTGGYKMYKYYHYIPRKKDTIPATTEKQQEKMVVTNMKEVDATGLCCPGPITRVKMEIDQLNKGDVLKIVASDVGFYEDIKAWCRRTKNELLEVSKNKGAIEAVIKKGIDQSTQESTDCDAKGKMQIAEQNDGKTIVVFSGDLDKAIAAFIIANGAAAMGKKVTLFFTFWGLNILRKPKNIKVSKNIIEKAFGKMMPRGSQKLQLSKMNMAGIGPKMIRGIMKHKNVQSLEELIQQAIDCGIEIVACTMSMDVMGIKEEELLDGVKLGGVGYYLGEAEESNVNLFI